MAGELMNLLSIAGKGLRGFAEPYTAMKMDTWKRQKDLEDLMTMAEFKRQLALKYPDPRITNRETPEQILKRSLLTSGKYEPIENLVTPGVGGYGETTPEGVLDMGTFSRLPTAETMPLVRVGEFGFKRTTPSKKSREATPKQVMDLAIKLAQNESGGFASEEDIMNKIPTAQQMLKGENIPILPKKSDNQYSLEQEQLIQDNMKAYKKTREEVIQALTKGKYL